MKKQLVNTGIILALLAANIIVTYQYNKDIKEYESKLDHQTEISKYRQKLIIDKNLEMDVLLQQIKEKDSQIKTKQNEIHKLKKELEKALHDGESPSVSVSRGESANKKAYFLVTAYTAGFESTGKLPSHPDYGKTASGEKVKEGRTIACPRSYPFGTKMKIDGIGYRVCEDRGGAIQQGRLDLYMESLTKAINFGKQTLLVEIIEEG